MVAGKDINKKQGGYSLPGVLVAAVISAILGAIAISNMWGSVDKAKVTAISSLIKETQIYLMSQAYENFSEIEKINENGDDNKIDYFADLVEAGAISPFPYKTLQDPEKLVWEIRKIDQNGKSKVFYIHFETPNEDDADLINQAAQKIGVEIATD